MLTVALLRQQSQEKCLAISGQNGSWSGKTDQTFPQLHALGFQALGDLQQERLGVYLCLFGKVGERE
jgi:hypothetical protein